MKFPEGTWREKRILTKKSGETSFMWFVGDDTMCAEFWYGVDSNGNHRDCAHGFEVYRFAPQGPRTIRFGQSHTGYAIPDGSTLCASRFIEDYGGRIPDEDAIWARVASWYEDRKGTPDPMDRYAEEETAEKAKEVTA